MNFYHCLDSYTQQSGTPRYSIRFLEKITLIAFLATLILFASKHPLHLLSAPAILWWAWRRGIIP